MNRMGLSQNGSTMKTVIVLANLGTPAEPTAQAVRHFLKPFLLDRRVVEIPRVIWLPILYLFILPFRSRKVAKLYQKIWDGDSPLRTISRRQVDRLASRLQSNQVEVRLGMTYGEPNLKRLIEGLIEDNVEKIIVLPLFPQFSATTTGAVHDVVAQAIQSSRNIPAFHLIRGYHDNEAYISALSSSVREHWQENGQGKKLLMSFHSIPKANIDKGDPYYGQCQETAGLLAKQLGLKEGDWAISFQSRLGKAEWLKPYTNELLKDWGKKGVEDVDIICPAFSVDCLETLEEIRIENRQVFIDSGGEGYRYIPCLNDREDHVALMEELVLPYI